jgi:hypothetical protein
LLQLQIMLVQISRNFKLFIWAWLIKLVLSKPWQDRGKARTLAEISVLKFKFILLRQSFYSFLDYTQRGMFSSDFPTSDFYSMGLFRSLSSYDYRYRF